MKQLLTVLLFTSFLSSAAVAAERIPARAWRRVKIYDMPALKKLDPLPRGKIVGLRFNYRHQTVRHLKPNWYQGSIWRVHRGAHDDYDFVQIMVSTADRAAFERLPSQVQATRTFVVYGEVQKDYEASFTFLRLFGTKVKRDAKGNAIVSW